MMKSDGPVWPRTWLRHLAVDGIDVLKSPHIKISRTLGRGPSGLHAYDLEIEIIAESYSPLVRGLIAARSDRGWKPGVHEIGLAHKTSKPGVTYVAGAVLESFDLLEAMSEAPSCLRFLLADGSFIPSHEEEFRLSHLAICRADGQSRLEWCYTADQEPPEGDVETSCGRLVSRAAELLHRTATCFRCLSYVMEDSF